MISKKVFYEGRVQGVGFRYTVKRIASGFDVTGWIKNLDDGRVELRAAGEPEELADFLTAIRESELAAHIRNAAEHEIEPLAGVKGFEIRH